MFQSWTAHQVVRCVGVGGGGGSLCFIIEVIIEVLCNIKHTQYVSCYNAFCLAFLISVHGTTIYLLSSPSQKPGSHL